MPICHYTFDQGRPKSKIFVDWPCFSLVPTRRLRRTYLQVLVNNKTIKIVVKLKNHTFRCKKRPRYCPSSCCSCWKATTTNNSAKRPAGWIWFVNINLGSFSNLPFAGDSANLNDCDDPDDVENVVQMTKEELIESNLKTQYNTIFVDID